jgi:3-oxoacyl-[acyl-carrier protein] reductase
MRLRGRVILVTGSSRGIGRITALEVGKEGGVVLVHYSRSRDDAEALVNELREMGTEALAFRANLSSEEEVRAMFRDIEERFGVLHGLVNNAGHASGEIWRRSFGELSWGDFEGVINIDLKGTFLCSKEALRLMVDGGSIVNVASIPARTGDVEGIPYLTVKGAVLSLTKAMALSLAPRIRVNAVMLGSIGTGWLSWFSDEEIARLRSWIPMGRFGEPREVARSIVFLLSDDSSFITGHVLVIDGGECTACD